jgi:hypothetical protein
MKKILLIAAMLAMMLAAGVPALAQADDQYNSAAQYEYAAGDQYGQYDQSTGGTSELPPTGGSSLVALGIGTLLVGGGLLARRIIR